MMMITIVIVALLGCVSASGVLQLDSHNIASVTSKGPVFVKFYAPWCAHCKNMAPAWTEYASTSKDVTVAEVDCTIHKDLCTAYVISSYPTLILIKDKKIYKFNRQRDIKEFVNFANEYYLQETTSSDDQPIITGSDSNPSVAARRTGEVVVLSDTSFKSTIQSVPGVWLVEFYAPWCGHCKSLAPTWDALAKKATTFNVAKIDCTVEKGVCTAFGIRGYPTIKVLAGGEQYEYQGARAEGDFINAANGGYKTSPSSKIPAAYA